MSDLFAALVALTMDLSGNDAAVVDKVVAFTQTPPTTREDIGFYGAETASAQERVLRATITALSDGGYIFGFEDKYISDMPYLLMDKGWIAQDDAAAGFVGAISDTYIQSGPDASDAEALQNFPAHAARLDAAATAAGRALLYFDVPAGDMFHLASVTPEIAAKWRNVRLLDTPSHSFAVTDPDWSLYWGFLTYSIGLDIAAVPALAPRPALRPLSEIGF